MKPVSFTNGFFVCHKLINKKEVNMKINITEKPEETKEAQVEENENLFNFLVNATENDSPITKSRTIGIYGDVDEDAGAAIVYSLFQLHSATEFAGEDDEDGNPLAIFEPIKMIISTQGGSAHEMFSIYDTMSMIKKDCDIETIGLGKVMSAGVLLLASGTKGKRSIGANCRVMLHPVAGGAVGDLQDIENDIQEIKWLQKQYIKCLAKETNLTEKKIRSIIRKKVNHYFDAEEAVKIGIADHIL